MDKTLVALTACLLLLGAVAAAPTAAADHGDRLPEENGTCFENPILGKVCLVSDDGWCWLVHHCPW